MVTPSVLRLAPLPPCLAIFAGPRNLQRVKNASRDSSPWRREARSPECGPREFAQFGSAHVTLSPRHHPSKQTNSGVANAAVSGKLTLHRAPTLLPCPLVLSCALCPCAPVLSCDRTLCSPCTPRAAQPRARRSGSISPISRGGGLGEGCDHELATNSAPGRSGDWPRGGCAHDALRAE